MVVGRLVHDKMWALATLLQDWTLYPKTILETFPIVFL